MRLPSGENAGSTSTPGPLGCVASSSCPSQVVSSSGLHGLDEALGGGEHHGDGIVGHELVGLEVDLRLIRQIRHPAEARFQDAPILDRLTIPRDRAIKVDVDPDDLRRLHRRRRILRGDLPKS